MGHTKRIYKYISSAQQVFQFSLPICRSKRLHLLHLNRLTFKYVCGKKSKIPFRYLFFQKGKYVCNIFDFSNAHVLKNIKKKLLYFTSNIRMMVALFIIPNEHEIILDCFVRSVGLYFTLLRVFPICRSSYVYNLFLYLIDINQRIRSISSFSRWVNNMSASVYRLTISCCYFVVRRRSV